MAVGEVLSSGGGKALGAVFAAASRIRPAEKPMHPRGAVVLGTLRRIGGCEAGAAFLDETGVDEVLVRESRSVGLPEPLPDVTGLAVRVPLGEGHTDLLFSGAATGALTRYVPRPGLRTHSGFLSTLLPFRSPNGPVHLGAVAGEDHWDLLWAHPRRPWSHFAVLELSDEPGEDETVSFDPAGEAPEGLEVYDWHRRLRGPAYAAARAARSPRRP